jgi:hypothetical protein
MVSRNGGDAGTAIHTFVPFGIAANMTLAFPEIWQASSGSPTGPDKRVPGKLPGAESGGGSDYPAKVCAFLIREIPETSSAKISRLGTVIGFSPAIAALASRTPARGPRGPARLTSLVAHRRYNVVRLTEQSNVI